jgi:hypothetical protein
MGFTNRVDVRGRQKMLEAPRGSPQSSSRAQQDGDDDGDAQSRSTAGARGRRSVRVRGRSAGEDGRYSEATGFIVDD